MNSIASTQPARPNRRTPPWPTMNGAGNAFEHPGSAVEVRALDVFYGDFQALFKVDIDVQPGRVTSMIGASGCGKSTVLRSINRINDRLGYVRVSGEITVMGENLLDPAVSLSSVRRQVGMVFQRPNPLPLTIRENVAFAHTVHGARQTCSSADRDDLVEGSLRRVALWDQVKDRLDNSALALSLEAQQKLCIARLLPLKPSVLLMDEPCSALDLRGLEAIERLIRELSGDYTILIVTHNMAQARRVSDECVFMHMGQVVESGATARLFERPEDERTANYIDGRFG